jgi:hypothetical protein
MMQDGSSAQTAPKPVEVLIHNVSHKDLLMGVCRTEDALTESMAASSGRYRRAKPAFSAFHPVSRALQRILEAKDGSGTAASADDLLECPSVEDNANGNTSMIVAGLRVRLPLGRSLQFSSSREPTARPLTARDVVLQTPLPPPVSLSAASVEDTTEQAATTPVGSDEEPERDGLAVGAVYFPLISVLVPKWLEISYDKSCRQCVYLISGSCTPRNPDADMSDNSTEATAKLIKIFLGLVYPVSTRPKFVTCDHLNCYVGRPRAWALFRWPTIVNRCAWVGTRGYFTPLSFGHSQVRRERKLRP